MIKGTPSLFLGNSTRKLCDNLLKYLLFWIYLSLFQTIFFSEIVFDLPINDKESVIVFCNLNECSILTQRAINIWAYCKKSHY